MNQLIRKVDRISNSTPQAAVEEDRVICICFVSRATIRNGRHVGVSSSSFGRWPSEDVDAPGGAKRG